jgi:hypothetical protein
MYRKHDGMADRPSSSYFKLFIFRCKLLMRLLDRTGRGGSGKNALQPGEEVLSKLEFCEKSAHRPDRLQDYDISKLTPSKGVSLVSQFMNSTA